MRILIDIDSTIADFYTPFIAWLNETFSVTLTPEDFVDWDLVRCVPGSIGFKVYDFFKTRIYHELKPYPNAVDTIKSWHDAGHEIVIVTWSSPSYAADGPPHLQDKAAWFKNNLPFLPNEAFTICDARYRISADVYIDDKSAATRKYREVHPSAKIWSVKHAFTDADHLDLVAPPDRAWNRFAEALRVLEKSKESGVEENASVCMTPLSGGGFCMTVDCQEHKALVQAGAYYPKSIWRSLGKMSSDGTLDNVDAEIAYLRELARDIHESTRVPAHLKFKLLQDNMKITVELIEKRERLMIARQFLLPHQTLQIIILRIKQILQRHIMDDALLSKLGTEIGQIDIANSKAALKLIGD